MLNNQTLNKFRENQENITAVLDTIKELISKGESLDIVIPKTVQNKISGVSDMIDKGSKLRVSLIGGFSEGKTAIAAGWIGNFDKSKMVISQKESTDEVSVYTVDDEIEIVDTPGLYGLKEKYNVATETIEKYKDITKQYVSQSHLVLYVMDSANPIKESHKDDLIWLFRDLNLLSRTVFVLSRFDEVADIEDEWDYRENLKIKQDNVIGRLKQLINLTAEEEKGIQILAVAANPYGNGMDYWLQHKNEYDKISRLGKLQEATNKALEMNGGFFSVIDEMFKSVVLDICGLLGGIETVSENINNIIQDYEDRQKDVNQEIDDVGKEINRVRINLSNYLVRYLNGLIKQARGSGMETIQGFVDSEIGKNGSILTTNIQIKFDSETQTVLGKIDNVQNEFNANVSHTESMLETMGKDGLKYLKNTNIINAQNIKIVRDGIVNVGKALGFDVAQYLKFKPWGAVNLAKNIGAALTVITVLLQIFDEIKRREAEEKFRKAVDEMVDTLGQIRDDLLGLVRGDDFINQFFPQYFELLEQLNSKTKDIKDYRDRQNQIKAWCSEVKDLSQKYRNV